MCSSEKKDIMGVGVIIPDPDQMKIHGLSLLVVTAALVCCTAAQSDLSAEGYSFSQRTRPLPCLRGKKG